MMLASRRRFIRALGGAGVGILALPTVSTLDLPSILNFVGLPAAGTIEGSLAEIHAYTRKVSPFSAFAAVPSRPLLIAPQRLVSPQRALRNIHERLGLRWAFGLGVDYEDADQCEKQFQDSESRMRRWRFNSFTDVQRARADRDVAYLTGGVLDSQNYLVEAVGSTQYQGEPAIDLVGVDAPVIEAAQAGHKEDNSPTRKEDAQSLTVIKKDTGDVKRIVYQTPTSEIAYLPYHRVEGHNWGNRAAGMVSVQRKRDPERVYYAELVA